ncbi:MAG: hypothetical protein K5657_00520 [Desulfovibrio sp.]|nr:hypothetical protein [Desulfovibrio sp.]
MTGSLVSGTPLGLLLLAPAFLTAAIETPLFWVLGFRRLHECLWFFVVNIVSNILLNEFLLTAAGTPHYNLLVAVCEGVVLLLEFALCRFCTGCTARRLWLTLLFCNVCSFAFGFLAGRVFLG